MAHALFRQMAARRAELSPEEETLLTSHLEACVSAYVCPQAEKRAFNTPATFVHQRQSEPQVL